MGLERGNIPHLLSGVSQRPDTQRHPTQLRKGDNVFGRWAHGLMRRPPSVHLGLLTSADLGFWDDAFLHEIPISEDSRFLAVVVNGGIKVYDVATRAEMTLVDKSGGDGYLTDPSAGFRAVTIGDTTVLVNRAVETTKGPRRSPRRPSEDVLVYVTQADYSTLYTVTIDGQEFVYVTDAGQDSHSRGAINTDQIAQGLADLILSNAKIHVNYTVEVFGSSLLIARRSVSTGNTAKSHINITVADGLGGKGLRLIKGKVQAFEDLPRKAKHGMLVEVTGDPLSTSDNYWVRYEDVTQEEVEGVWRETVAPDINISFDEKKMPHLLTAQGQELDETLMSEVPGDRPQIIFNLTFTTTAGWEEDQDGARSDDTQGELKDDADFVKTPLVLDQALPGTLTQKKFRLKIPILADTTVVESGVAAKLQVKLFDGNVTTHILEDRTYLPGMNIEDEITLDVDKQVKSGAKIEVHLVQKKNLPLAEDRKPRFRYPEKFLPNGDPEGPIKRPRRPPITTEIPGSTDFVFVTTVTYPKGVKFSVTLDPDGVDEATVDTTLGSDQTGTQVATTLAGLIDALGAYTATNPQAGTVRIQSTTTGKQVNVRYEAVFPAGNLVFFNKDLVLVPNVFAGKTLVNKSDGWKADILSNTATTITVDGGTIVGGVNQDLQPGEVCYVEGTGAYFTYGPAAWSDRDAGDEETNAYPGFIDEEIQEVFFFKGRLVLTSKENVTLSGAGDLFNLWRTTVVSLLPSDRIDVKAAHAKIANFHSIVPWAEDLLLWADNAQVRIAGDPLTPESTGLPVVSSYFNVGDVRPVLAGDVILFPYAEREHVLVYEYTIPENKNETAPPRARDLTFEVPAYIPGRVQDWAVDASQGILALTTDLEPASVFVFSWTAASEEARNAGWWRWPLPPSSEVKAMAFSNAKLLLVVKQADGVWLDEIDLDVDIEPAMDERARYLDRRFDETQAVSVVFDGGNNWTTITMPYSVNTDQVTEGEVAVVRRDSPFTRYTVTRPAANQVRVAGSDLTAVPLWVGIKYLSEAELGRIYTLSFQTNLPRTYGRTQLHYADIWFHDTTDFTVRVTGFDGTPVDYTITEEDPRDDSVRASISENTKHVSVIARSDTPGGFRVSAVDFEAYFHDRTRDRG